MFYSALHLVPSRIKLARISFWESIRKRCKQTGKLSPRTCSMRVTVRENLTFPSPYGPSSSSPGVNGQAYDPAGGDYHLATACAFTFPGVGLLASSSISKGHFDFPPRGSEKEWNKISINHKAMKCWSLNTHFQVHCVCYVMAPECGEARNINMFGRGAVLTTTRSWKANTS